MQWRDRIVTLMNWHRCNRNRADLERFALLVGCKNWQTVQNWLDQKHEPKGKNKRRLHEMEDEMYSREITDKGASSVHPRQEAP